MRIAFRLLLSGVLAALIATAGTSALAQQRLIRLNGAILTDYQAYQLDNLAGTHVPNGAYWLDFETGLWGYEGNPTPQGRLDLRARSTEPGYNVRTPGGDLMSDGECAFVAGVPVGNCD